MYVGGEAKLQQVFDTDRRRGPALRESPLTLLCECGEPGCRHTVQLSVEEYDASRPGLILHPEHAPCTVVYLADRRAGS